MLRQSRAGRAWWLRIASRPFGGVAAGVMQSRPRQWGRAATQPHATPATRAPSVWPCVRPLVVCQHLFTVSALRALVSWSAAFGRAWSCVPPAHPMPCRAARGFGQGRAGGPSGPPRGPPSTARQHHPRRSVTCTPTPGPARPAGAPGRTHQLHRNGHRQTLWSCQQQHQNGGQKVLKSGHHVSPKVVSETRLQARRSNSTACKFPHLIFLRWSTDSP